MNFDNVEAGTIEEVPYERKWGQEQITDWAQKEFGNPDALATAKRMKKEVEELITHLEEGELNEAAEECCDVEIMLRQVATLVWVNLDQGVDQKMEVNVKRKWERTEEGDFQHVD